MTQPFQYDSRLAAAKGKSITQATASARNLNAAIDVGLAAPRANKAFCSISWQTRMYLPGLHGNRRSRQQSCRHYKRIRKHRAQNTLQLRTHEQPHIAEQGGSPNSPPQRSQLAAATLPAKHNVSCSGFLPNTNPMQQPRSHHNAPRSTPQSPPP